MFEKRNNKSLIGMALQTWESDTSWEAIAELQMRGSPETVALAQRMARSRNWRKRALGMYIASQLRQRKKGGPLGSIEFALESTQALLLAGLHDQHKEVVRAAASGFGHRPHPAALSRLIELSQHPEWETRIQVVFALNRYADADSVDALVRLAKDKSDEVRDWATFGLGSMLDADGPEIRNVLWQNLQDSDEDVRGEALAGLAVRKDERIIPLLLERLDANCQCYELEAAEQMASPLLLEQLEAIHAEVAGLEKLDAYWYRCLNDAIAACKVQ